VTKTILLTGATGTLGTEVINQIKNNKSIKIIIISRKKNKEYKRYQYKKNSIKKIYDEKIFGIIHMATCYGKKNETIKEIIDCNYKIPLELFKLSIKKKANFFLNCDTYFHNNLNLPLGVSKYVETKKKFINKIKSINKNRVKIINCKILHMYSEKDDHTKFLNKIVFDLKKNKKEIGLTKCKQKIDFINYKDVAGAIKLILKNILEKNNIQNNLEIGTGNSIELRKLFLYFKKKIKSKSKLNFGFYKNRIGEKKVYIANIKNLKKINWKPNYKGYKGFDFFLRQVN